MRLLKSNQRGVFLLVILAVLFCVLNIQIQSTPSIKGAMDFLNAIAVSTVAAFIFYIFQVLVPERRRRNIFKQDFGQQWTNFKLDFIRIFLWALDGSYEGDMPERLCDVKTFREFAREEDHKGSVGWNGVLNGLREDHIRDLVIALDRLKGEVTFLLNKVEIDDPEVLAFFKRLLHVEYELRSTNLHDDSLKTFSHFVWEVFAGWSFVSGERNDDMVKTMIGKI